MVQIDRLPTQPASSRLSLMSADGQIAGSLKRSMFIYWKLHKKSPFYSIDASHGRSSSSQPASCRLSPRSADEQIAGPPVESSRGARHVPSHPSLLVYKSYFLVFCCQFWFHLRHQRDHCQQQLVESSHGPGHVPFAFLALSLIGN